MSPINTADMLQEVEGLPEVQFKVPGGYFPAMFYGHCNSLFTFGNGKTTEDDKGCFQGENFWGTTDSLYGDRSIIAKFFVPRPFVVSTNDCVTFLQHKNALLLGAPGLVLLATLAPRSLPVNTTLASFDRRERLGINARGRHSVPSLRVAGIKGDLLLGPILRLHPFDDARWIKTDDIVVGFFRGD